LRLRKPEALRFSADLLKAQTPPGAPVRMLCSNQGTTSIRPHMAKKDLGFSPCAFLRQFWADELLPVVMKGGS
jgi:hypothetical protein